MINTSIVAAIAIAAAGSAQAEPLPAPPTEIYTPPAQLQCNVETMQVYFPVGTSALTPASRAILQAVRARLDGCIVGLISLSATAVDASSDAEAARLAEARIETVAVALEDYDLAGMTITSNTNRADNEQSRRMPMDRKVEIHLAAWAPEIN